MENGSSYLAPQAKAACRNNIKMAWVLCQVVQRDVKTCVKTAFSRTKLNMVLTTALAGIVGTG